MSAERTCLRSNPTILAVAALLLGEPRIDATAQVLVEPLGPPQKPFGYGSMAKRWPHRTGEPTFIPVCWESTTDDDKPSRDLVIGVLKATWSHAAAINFTGWMQCTTADQEGIHVGIGDEGERTVLGSDLNGVTSGMILNFSMVNSIPSRWCTLNATNRTECIKSLAVHEFGHALGLAHEQSRSDTPGECWADPQGPKGDRKLTSYWDKDSVMNYCHDILRLGGWKLSSGDVKSIVAMYGRR